MLNAMLELCPWCCSLRAPLRVVVLRFALTAAAAAAAAACSAALHTGAHMVPTCTGEFKHQMVAFLDRFGNGPPGSVSVGSSLDSLDNTAAADAEQEAVEAAVGKP
jgi:ABC-type sugar transport system substrate-binding protein